MLTREGGGVEIHTTLFVLFAATLTYSSSINVRPRLLHKFNLIVYIMVVFSVAGEVWRPEMGELLPSYSLPPNFPSALYDTISYNVVFDHEEVCGTNPKSRRWCRIRPGAVVYGNTAGWPSG